LMKDEGEVVAVDRNPARLGLVRKLCERLGLACVRREVGDLTEMDSEGLGSFDRVLLDAPCTALGVLRRHPEGKWRRDGADRSRMAEVQRELLDVVGPLVRPGGVLVYSVCTISEAEGSDLIRSWVADHPEFSVEDPRHDKKASWHQLVRGDGILTTWPDLDDMDGFFGVRLRRAK
jgi:16S rRNA (cytosine967-C5)-methyltransferase